MPYPPFIHKQPKWPMSEHVHDYRRWDLPAQVWSGADGYDEAIILTHEKESGWHARTTLDQCDRRDLDASEIASILREFEIEAV